jgi:hypothetical protein
VMGCTVSGPFLVAIWSAAARGAGAEGAVWTCACTVAAARVAARIRVDFIGFLLVE